MKTHPEAKSAGASAEAGAISVIIPAYNEAKNLPSCIRALFASLEKANWRDAEVVVVNDGSTDDTRSVLAHLAADFPIRIIEQANRGRFLARRTGLLAATGRFLFFVDARVVIGEDSLAFVRDQIERFPERLAWNSHVEIDTSNFFARFWHYLTRVGWFRYFISPRLRSFGLGDFDYFPKGTGCFLAPRAVLLRAYEGFSSLFEDPSLVSDDTSLLRSVAGEMPIWIAPEFASSYDFGRRSLGAFMRHAYVRGVHLLDSFKPTSVYFWVAMLLFAALHFSLVLVFLWPILAIIFVLTAVALVLLASIPLRIRPRETLAFLMLGPFFALAYSGGMWKGVWELLRSVRLRSSRLPTDR